MKQIFAVILLIGAMNFVSGCMMLHDGVHGQGHHGGVSAEPDGGGAPRSTHGH